MSISDTITITAGQAISQLNALAEAAARADEAMAKIRKGGIGAGAGPSGLVSSWEKAASAISGIADKIAADIERIGKAADAASGASAKIAGVGDAAASSAGGFDAAATAAGRYADSMRAVTTASADASVAMGRAGKVSADAAIGQDAAVIASARQRSAAARQAAADAEASSRRHTTALLGIAAVAGYGIYKAGQLQAGTTRLVTTAGESPRNQAMIQAGILKLAGQTATSQQQLLQGAYMAESAGFHGGSALNVLRAGAEGAFAEGAPLGDTVNALTSLMNAYGMRGAKAPMSAMNQIISMVSRGKMTMAGAVSALPTVLPVAASAGLGFGQVGGALATMTAMGSSPDLAAQHLSHTIGSLQNMSGVQTREIQQLGGDPVKLQKNLGKTGLLGTLTDISKLVTGSMGSSGLVLMKTFNQSASAAADANKMLGALPPSVRGVAQAYADGTISAKQWNKEMFSGSESPQQKNLLQQFATVENKARGFSDLLKSGSPAAQTYQATLSKALGGQTGLQTFLQLMGVHQGTTAANTAAVTAAGRRPGADVTGWGDVQKTLKFQLGSFEQNLESVATQMGQVMLPVATGALKFMSKPLGFLSDHPGVEKGLTVGGGALGVGYLLQKSLSPLTTALKGLGTIGKALGVPGADKLANLGQNSGLTGAAAKLTGAAAALDGAAEKLGGAGGLGGTAGRAGRAGGAAAGAEGAGVAGAGETAGLSAGMLGPVALGVGAGAALALWANQFKKYDHPAPAAQLGPRSSFVSSPAWKQYDAPAKPSAGFTNTLAQAMGKPVKMPPPDLSAMSAAKGKAVADGKAIQQAAENALKKPAKAAAPNLSAYTQAVPKARAAGVSVSSGFASGIEAGKGAAVAAAADVASAAAAAMAHAVQSRSPSRVTQKIGKDTAQGFILGLEGGKSAVDAAATALGKNAAKAADITSIDTNVKKLLGEVPKGDTGLTKMLKADQGKLEGLAKQRSKLEQEITNAQDIAKNAISAANITGAADYQPVLASAGGPVSSYATIAGMQGMAADQKQFASTVAQLKKQGLNATSLTQIQQAGPSALPMAQGLAQGGKGAVSQVNALEQQIHASAAKLGDVGGPAMFQAGADAAKGLAAGIKSQLGSVDAAMKQLAQHMVNAVKSALKSHSPSLVMAEVGLSIPQGVAMGIDQGTGTAMSAMGRMGSRLGATAPSHVPQGYGHPAAGGFHGGGGQVVHNHYTTVNVQGNVHTENDLLNALQERQLVKASNNWQGGWNLPGRAG